MAEYGMIEFLGKLWILEHVWLLGLGLIAHFLDGRSRGPTAGLGTMLYGMIWSIICAVLLIVFLGWSIWQAM